MCGAKAKDGLVKMEEILPTGVLRPVGPDNFTLGKETRASTEVLSKICILTHTRVKVFAR
jgi:hypothetical protein